MKPDLEFSFAGASGMEVHANVRWSPAPEGGVKQDQNGHLINMFVLTAANRQIHRLARKLRNAQVELAHAMMANETRPALAEELYERLLKDPRADDLWPLLQSIAALMQRRSA